MSLCLSCVHWEASEEEEVVEEEEWLDRLVTFGCEGLPGGVGSEVPRANTVLVWINLGVSVVSAYLSRVVG